MRLAILTDIHGNREAFTAVMADLEPRQIDRIVLLGDLVGYGPDPEWCTERAMALVAAGALAVLGNHDHAIGTPAKSMSALARHAIDWTRPRLSDPQRSFLAALPLTAGHLLRSVKRMLMIEPDARVACVNVIKTARIGIDVTTDDDGNSLHVARLVALKHWAAPLDLPEGLLTYAILEGADPGQAIIDYATHTHVDHILMGARGHSQTRRYLGSVSSQVVAEAPCSVSVIRLPERGPAVPPA